jgi:hypothetical protein
MADYHPLITRAVEGLGNNTAEARRTLYERARAALVAQLRGIDPPLSEAEITRERLALEDAIRKVEAESVRKARSEPRPAPPAPRAINAMSRQSIGGAMPSTPAPPAWRDRQSGAPGDTTPPRAEAKFSDLSGQEDLSGKEDLSRKEELARREPPQANANKTASSESPRPAEPPASARSRLLGARTSERPPQDLKFFRKPMAAADDSAVAPPQKVAPSRDAHNDHRDEFSDRHEATWNHTDRADYEQSPDLIEDGSAPMHGLEQAYDLDNEQRIEPGRPPVRRPLEPADHYREPRTPRSYRGLAQLIAAVLIVVGVSSLVYWQWSNINSVYQFLSHMRSRQSQTAQQPAGEPKFGGRVPQEQTRPQPPAAPNAQGVPATAQRVVLYEEDPGNPQGKQYIGSAMWRTETISPGSGLAPELQIRADVTIAERNMTVTWSLRRNTDQALPASHTIEIMFNLPPDFPGGGIANVPGVLMKESEQARGVPLAGLAVKVTNGFFLIGLSAVDADVQRNMQLLKERPWFDVPLVYNNGGRAILALEKGPSGDRAFADAFAAWGK